MEASSGSAELLFESLESYSKTTFELGKLKAMETLSKGIAGLLARLVVVVMILLFVVILSIGVALLLGELLGKTYYGFFVVAAFYLVTALLSHFFLYKWIKAPIGNTLINQVFQ